MPDATNLLPESCQACGARHDYLIEPRPKYQRRTVVMLLIAGAVTIVWGFCFTVLLPHLGIPVSYVTWVLVIAAPGLLIGVVAMRIRKVVDINCLQCGHRERRYVRA